MTGTRSSLLLCALLAAGVLGAGGVAGGVSGADTSGRIDVESTPATVIIGHSRQGRPIPAVVRAGSPTPTRTIAVIGSVHGDEPAGVAVTEVLGEVLLPSWLRLLLIPTVNPDGLAAGVRPNATGVDLNRNAPTGWLPAGASPYTVGGYDPGPRPVSEPETAAIIAYLAATRPDAVLWYHQPWASVVCTDGTSWCGRFAARVGLPIEDAPRPGSLSQWSAANGIPSAVVELPDGPADVATVLRHAAAVLALLEPPAVAGWAAADLAGAGPPVMAVELLNVGDGVGVARLTVTEGWGDCTAVSEAAVPPGGTVRLECVVLGPVPGHTWVADLLDPADGRIVARAVGRV